MEWNSDPDSVGAWLRDRLDDELSSSMHGTIPRGFDAYARVFHPAEVRSLSDRSVPTMDEWNRMPDDEHVRLIALFSDKPATWAETAAAFGTTMHALAQWQRIVKTPPETDWRARLAPDGREFTSPAEGEMVPALLAAVARHLVAHTSTPDAGFAGVWEGWGGFVGHYGATPSRAFLELSDDPAHAQVMAQSIHDRFNNPFRKATWQPGIVADDVSNGERLSLPARDHVLFSAPPSVFADPEWILDALWRDREQEQRGFPPSAQHPSILWPADHAWVMASEIDFDSTIVAGSAALIEEICADEHLEAFPIPEGSELHWDADRVNQ